MTDTTILYIDSNRELAQFLIEDLEVEGYKVVFVDNGTDALACASERPFELVIIDRELIDIDSLRLCRNILGTEPNRDTPAIVLSSYEDRDDIIAALDSGAVDYITKPFYYPILSARIRSIVRVKDYMQKLTVARDEALAAKQSKSMLLANMSHEIRMPLNGILGLTSLLMTTDQKPQQLEHLNTIQSSGHLLLELINNLLDHSKLEQEEIQFESVPFSIEEIIRGITNIIEPTIQDKSVSLMQQLDEKLANKYLGDPARIRQVLLNLMSNAVKFTRKGEVTIQVNLESYTNNSHRIKVSVIDTGIGLDEEEAKLLFQPYQQASASIQRQFGGTGLGLAICKQIIERLGGEIGVTSVKGDGSVFWFTIDVQVHQEQQSDDRLEQLELNKTEVIQGLFNNKRILVAEDNLTNQLVINAYLKPTQADVVIAENGKQCLERSTSEHFDLILMDGHMPQMDGFETTRLIRTEPQYQAVSDIPIIAMTANALAGDEALCISSGMNGYLSKPIEPNQFYRTIHEWLV